jgi:hypothetical protein
MKSLQDWRMQPAPQMRQVAGPAPDPNDQADDAPFVSATGRKRINSETIWVQNALGR